MTKDEALKLALEALEANLGNWGAKTKAIPVIREALAQPEQERNFCPRCGKRLSSNDWDVHTCTPSQHNQLADEMLTLLKRYRKETPLGHQPHMIAHLADEVISKYEATHVSTSKEGGAA